MDPGEIPTEDTIRVDKGNQLIHTTETITEQQSQNHNSWDGFWRSGRRRIFADCFQKVIQVKTVFFILSTSCVLIGIIVGILVSQYANHPLSKTTYEYLYFPGELLLRALTFVWVPLISSSMILSISSIGDFRSQKRIGLIAIFYYIATTIIAVLLGIALTMVIQPGYRSNLPWGPSLNGTSITSNDLSLERLPIGMNNFKPGDVTDAYLGPWCEKVKNLDNLSAISIIMRMLRNIVPKNIFDAISFEIDCGVNVLGVIACAITIGLVMSTMEKKKVSPLLDALRSLNEVLVVVVRGIMWYAPFGIMFLIIWRFSKEPGQNLWVKITRLGWYIGTVLLGLLIHSFIILPMIYLIFTRKNIFKHIRGVLTPLLTALSTSSSSATAPTVMQACENNLKMERKVTRFVVALGATINMDGTALYEAVAVIFIAQYLRYEMNILHYITIVIVSTMASIGAAGVPESGLIALVMVVQSVGLRPNAIEIILAMDWILDRFRTVVNIWSDTIGAAITDTYLKGKERESIEQSIAEVKPENHQDSNLDQSLEETLKQ